MGAVWLCSSWKRRVWLLSARRKGYWALHQWQCVSSGFLCVVLQCFVEHNWFHLIGIICGLAIYNFTVVDLHFPLALYKKLLNVKPCLEDLKELSPTEGRYENQNLQLFWKIDIQLRAGSAKLDKSWWIKHLLILLSNWLIWVTVKTYELVVDFVYDFSATGYWINLLRLPPSWPPETGCQHSKKTPPSPPSESRSGSLSLPYVVVCVILDPSLSLSLEPGSD